MQAMNIEKGSKMIDVLEYEDAGKEEISASDETRIGIIGIIGIRENRKIE